MSFTSAKSASSQTAFLELPPDNNSDSDEEKSNETGAVFKSRIAFSTAVRVPIPLKLKKSPPLKQVLSWAVWNTYTYDGNSGLRALYAKNPEEAAYYTKNAREGFCEVLKTKQDLLKKCLEMTLDRVLKDKVALEDTIFSHFPALFDAYKKKWAVLEEINNFCRNQKSASISEFFQKILNHSNLSINYRNKATLNLDDLNGLAVHKALFNDFHRLVWKGKEVKPADYGKLTDTPDGEKAVEKLFPLFPKLIPLINKFLKSKKELEDNLKNQKFSNQEISQVFADTYCEFISQAPDINRADISLAAFLEGIRIRILFQQEKGVKVIKEGAKYFQKTVTIYQEQDKFLYCTHMSG